MNAPIIYDLSIPDASNHYLEVSARIPVEGASYLDLTLPVWTPGSYMVRDYAKHIDDGVTAAGDDGQVLRIFKTDLSKWRVETSGAKVAVVRYRVYAHDVLSVCCNWIERDFALINGAATFLTVANSAPREHIVNVPQQWGEPATALEAIEPYQFRAANFDALVDGPITLGVSDRKAFVVDGVSYSLSCIGEEKVWDSGRAASDLQRAVHEVHALWGQVPFERYSFLNVLSERGGGGLEHASSSTLITSRWSTRNHNAHLDWLHLATHELIHAWNVKRLRPVELGPFDYSRATMTDGLWIAEGFTSYYDKLLVRRSGLSTDSEFLGRLSDMLAAVQNAPGAKVQSLCESSREAWIKHYHPGENSKNTGISYYDKGVIIALLLDAEIRSVTAGSRSLDDVMRFAYTRYAGDVGYSVAQFQAVASDVAHVDLGPWFARTVHATDPLPLDEGLAKLGLRLAPLTPQPSITDRSQATTKSTYLGVSTRISGHALVVDEVMRNTPAARAGLNVGDEIIAIDAYRITPGDFDTSLSHYLPGDTVSLLVSRHGKVMRLENLTFAPRPRFSWVLELDPNANDTAVKRRESWLQSASDNATISVAAGS
ncbi:MAG: M61 family metallopeptidase [Clostridia bacterium]|nr:M61 family metallopeptidase [Deltaproteobacteria bacterium]